LRTAVVIASRLIEFRQPEAYFAQSEFRTKRSQSILNFGGWPRYIDQRRQLSTWSLLCLVTMPETCQVGEGRVVEHLCSGSAPALLRPFGQRPPSTSRCSFLLDVSVLIVFGDSASSIPSPSGLIATTGALVVSSCAKAARQLLPMRRRGGPLADGVATQPANTTLPQPHLITTYNSTKTMFRKRIRTPKQETQKRWVHTTNECAWCSVRRWYRNIRKSTNEMCRASADVVTDNKRKHRSITCHEVLSCFDPLEHHG
jgi:hypothetical protein